MVVFSVPVSLFLKFVSQFYRVLMKPSSPHCHLPFMVMSQVNLAMCALPPCFLLYSQYYKICFEFYNFVAF